MTEICETTCQQKIQFNMDVFQYFILSYFLISYVTSFFIVNIEII